MLLQYESLVNITYAPMFQTHEDLSDDHTPQKLPRVLHSTSRVEETQNRISAREHPLVSPSFSSPTNLRHPRRIDEITQTLLFIMSHKKQISHISQSIRHCTFFDPCAASLQCILANTSIQIFFTYNYRNAIASAQISWASLVFLSPEMQALRMALAALAIGVSFATFASNFCHGSELIPTVLRYTEISWILFQEQNRPFWVNWHLLKEEEKIG